MWVSVAKIAQVLNLTPRAIQKKVRRNEITKFRYVGGNGKGRGGKVLEIDISDPAIPTDAKLKLLEANQMPCGGAETGIHSPSSACALDTQRGHGLLVPLEQPNKARTIALARLDLLNAWETYRKNHTSKVEANREFIKAFNSGLIHQDLHSILGDIAEKTLYRWKNQRGSSGDYENLIPGNILKNKMGTRLSEVEKNTLLHFLLNPAKFDIGTAIRLVKTRLENIGNPSDKSDRTFRRFVDEYKDKHYDYWILAREGQKALKDKVMPYIKRDPSQLAVGEVFIADGHRLNFQVINPFNGKPCRAIIVGYLDWKSYALAGYEIMLEENTQCILSAFRDSIIRLGKLPKIAYQDNGKAFRSRFFTSTESLKEAGIYGLFERLGVVPVFARPYNARAKLIERWFRGFSATFERSLPSYCGTSIANKPAWLMRNEKFHRALHEEYIPSIEETIQLIEVWLEWHHAQQCPHVKGKTIGQVFDEGRGPGVNMDGLDDLMMAVEKSTISRNGIRFLNADYYDDVFYGLRDKVILKYSLFDLSYVKVYDTKGGFLCDAKRVMPVHPMANHLGDVKDAEELKQALSSQRKLERKTIQVTKEFMKRGKTFEIGQDQIASLSPRVIEKMGKENTPLLETIERIPDEATKNNSFSVEREDNDGQKQVTSSPEKPKRPFFGLDVISRYQWHLENGFNEEEDLIFKKEFEETNTYRMSFQFFELQEMEMKRAQIY